MIETERLKLVPATLEHFAAYDKGGEAGLAQLLGVQTTDGWLVFPEAMTFSRDYLQQTTEEADWWTYFFIYKADGKLIGTGGFKGKPDADGVCEIGYSIAPFYEGKGLATEAARGLADFAFSHHNIQIVRAHTLAAENASNSLLKKIGMQLVKQISDTEDGDIWQWQVRREDYKND